jgi:hypothetical protein
MLCLPDMMIDGLTPPPAEGAAAQSHWAVRGAGCGGGDAI